MVAVPTVRSFCGCCDLKAACVVIASVRIFGNIIAILIYPFLLFFLNEIFVTKEEDKINEFAMAEDTTMTLHSRALLLICIFFAMSVINIIVSYSFIRGVTSNKPDKMRCYLFIVGCSALIFAIQLDKFCFIVAAIESYTFLCSRSLYLECVSSLQANGVNTTVLNKNEQGPPPPSYNSCENVMQDGEKADGTYPKLYP